MDVDHTVDRYWLLPRDRHRKRCAQVHCPGKIALDGDGLARGYRAGRRGGTHPPQDVPLLPSPRADERGAALARMEPGRDRRDLCHRAEALSLKRQAGIPREEDPLGKRALGIQKLGGDAGSLQALLLREDFRLLRAEGGDGLAQARGIPGFQAAHRDAKRLQPVGVLRAPADNRRVLAMPGGALQ